MILENNKKMILYVLIIKPLNVVNKKTIKEFLALEKVYEN
jgi:hypothetical protein